MQGTRNLRQKTGAVDPQVMGTEMDDSQAHQAQQETVQRDKGPRAPGEICSGKWNEWKSRYI